MARAKRTVPEINGGSMADIAFMLLIFFLVATTMDIDSGLSRKLPPPPDKNKKDEQKMDVKKRNVFVVLLNSNDDLLVANEILSVKNLREKAKEFIENPNDDELLPEAEPLSAKKEKAESNGDTKEANNIKEAIQLVGDMRVTKGVISLQNDRGSSYGAYLEVQNELVAAFNELRDELALKKFGKKYDNLEEDKAEVVRLVYPQRISEAEPKNIGGNK